MSKLLVHCDAKDCFAIKENGTCKCLSTTYDHYIECPFYKTNDELRAQIKHLREQKKI